MKRVSICIVILSLLSITYSVTIPAYTNKDEYLTKYGAIDWQELGSKKASERFHELRGEYLSNKYVFQDYGFTFLTLGISSLLLYRSGKFVSAPSSKMKISLVGFAAAVLTAGGYIGGLVLGFYRGAYPWWADSMAIPIVTVPFVAVVFIAWAALNLLAMNGRFEAGAPISFRQFKGSSYFYLLLLFLTALLVLLFVVAAYFWMVLPGVFWLYFYSSLWAGRNAANKSGEQGVSSGASV